jgi:hypothetical protein
MAGSKWPHTLAIVAMSGLGAVTASAQVPPVGPGVCVPVPGMPCTLPMAPGGLGGAAGFSGAMTGMSIGLGILSILQGLDEAQQEQAAAPVPLAPITVDAMAAPRAAILGRLRPMGRGSYEATAPDAPIDTQRAAILDQIRPPDASPATMTGGAGIGAGAGGVPDAALLAQLRPIGAAEAASADARAPFDTPKPGPAPHNAADQLCQAAGADNGCIGTPGRRSGTTVGGAVPVAETDAAIAVPPLRGGCRAAQDLDRPVALPGVAAVSARDSGYPIAATLDRLQAFTYSDALANLRSMSPKQLATLRSAARQDAARIEQTIDLLKARLFGAELGATAPLQSWADAGTDEALEAARDVVPFWRQMATLGRHATKAELQTVKEFLDQVDTAATAKDIADGSLARALHGVAERPALPELVRTEAAAVMATVEAAEAARNGDWAGAAAHGGEAANALLPSAHWLVPEGAAQTFVRWQAYLTVGLIAVDIGARSYALGVTQAAARNAQVASAASAMRLSRLVQGLGAKLEQARTAERLIDETLHCS